MSTQTFGATATAADFRNHIAEHLDAAQREPVTITNRGRARAVVVSTDFYERALEALEDASDIAAAAAARAEDGPYVTHEDLMRELGIEPVAGSTR